MARSSWGVTPRESIAQECARRGSDAVVSGCIALLDGDDADPLLIVALGGPPARWVLTGERSRCPSDPEAAPRSTEQRVVPTRWMHAATSCVAECNHLGFVQQPRP